LNRLIAISTGEASGDLHAANLLHALTKSLPGHQFAGVGGDALQFAGMQLWARNSEIGVVGLAEVGAARNQLLELYRFWGNKLYQNRPALLLCVDYGGFHLLLMRLAHRLGIPTVHYIPSKLWTWGEFRATFYRRWVDEVLSIFPFEADFLYRRGIRARYVGNPITDHLADYLPRVASPRQKLHPSSSPLICLFPGSRAAEIRYILPEMFHAAELIHSNIPAAKFAMALAPTIPLESVNSHLAGMKTPIEIYAGDYRELLLDADVGLIKSGTSCLEASLLGLPHMLIYKTSTFTWEIGSRLAKITWMGLPNLIMNREITPELRQYAATSQNIADVAIDLLSNESRRRRMLEDFAELRRRMGSGGAGEEAAQAVVEFMHKRGIL
jgi:lipid-A-disaccharide synthase